MMKVIIEIPNHEFDNDVKDKFQDYFRRVGIDISHGTMCGNYERETTDMFLASFKRLQVLPDNATNGELFLLANKNATIFEEGEKRVQVVLDTTVDNHIPCAIFNKTWWNAPYKGSEG